MATFVYFLMWSTYIEDFILMRGLALFGIIGNATTISSLLIQERNQMTYNLVKNWPQLNNFYFTFEKVNFFKIELSD